MRGGPRQKRVYPGNCMAQGCTRPMRAQNLCNTHYLSQYFSREPINHYERGRRWVRRSTLILELSQIADLNFRKSRKVIRIIFNTITDALQRGEVVQIPGFGTFSPHIPDSTCGYSIKFDPHKELLTMINSRELS